MANILVVEDEKSMQEIIVEYMQRGGHTCFTADDGMDALMVLKNHPLDRKSTRLNSSHQQ